MDVQIAVLEKNQAEDTARVTALEKAVAAIEVSGPAAGAKDLSKPFIGNCDYWTGQNVRDTFIAYFMRRAGYPDPRFTSSDASLAPPDHMFQHSSSVVPHGDKTLLFANAGMNQYKPIFLGQIIPNTRMEVLGEHGSAANSQKCIRAGGKHNDLDDVGRDNYHHTFFEMLGNWSFGSYFKQEAIDWAWDLLTNVYGLDGSRLYATYFEGDEKQGLKPDNEARDMWMRYMPAHRVIPGNAKDNFWEMGDTGPCGPCSELHYDRIGGRQVPELVNMDDPNVLEIWNIVFMQFNRESDRSLKALPKKGVDTGMGLERVVSVLQDKTSNYDTDLFAPIFTAIHKLTDAKTPYTGLMGSDDTDLKDMAYRVIADHIRTLTFAITDGARPSSEGRGYVLRRILRRGVYYGMYMLGMKTGFFAKIVPTVVDTFKDSFPELVASSKFVQEVVLDEEESFARTITKGMRYFKKVADMMQAKNLTVITAGDVTFLSDSLGFPADLTQRMAEERNPPMSVDMEGYLLKMEELKELSREAGKKNSGPDLRLESEETVTLEGMNVGTTDDLLKFDVPVDGTPWLAEGLVVKAVITMKKEFVGKAEKGTVCGIVLDKTPFYAEAGGQMNDMGSLSSADFTFRVENVQKFGCYILHVGTVTKGEVVTGANAIGQVDTVRRALLASNHSATHILNYGLREVLKVEIDQKGSIVTSDKLRFDFNSKAMKPKDIIAVEKVVNAQMTSDYPVYTEVVPLKTAMSIKCLRAVFGETYPDPVRVVSVGQPVQYFLDHNDGTEKFEYSVELCGGTHVTSLKQLENFVIVEETGISKGVRRIVGLTRDAAAAAIEEGERLAVRVEECKALKGQELMTEEKNLRQVVDSACIGVGCKAALNDSMKSITKAVIKYKKAAAEEGAKRAVAAGTKVAEDAKAAGKATTVHRINFGADGMAARKLMEACEKIHPGGAFLFVSGPADGSGNGKMGCYAKVPKAMSAKLNAKEWANAAIVPAGGKGGGKPVQAQAVAALTGDVSTVDACIKAGEAFLKK